MGPSRLLLHAALAGLMSSIWGSDSRSRGGITVTYLPGSEAPSLDGTIVHTILLQYSHILWSLTRWSRRRFPRGSRPTWYCATGYAAFTTGTLNGRSRRSTGAWHRARTMPGWGWWWRARARLFFARGGPKGSYASGRCAGRRMP